MRFRTIAAATLVTALMSACTPGGQPTETVTPVVPSPTTSATSASATPLVSPSASPSSSSTTATPDAALVKEAMALNQKEFEVTWALQLNGVPRGTKPKDLTDLMLPGEGLDAALNILWQIWEAGAHGDASIPMQMTHVRVVEERQDDSLMTVRSCRDGRKFTYSYPDGSTTKGVLLEFTNYMKRDASGELKIMDWRSKEVTQC